LITYIYTITLLLFYSSVVVKKASCKNKAQVGSSTHDPSTGLNAFERHALAAEEAKREITVSPNS
jgi:hypothetical protein